MEAPDQRGGGGSYIIMTGKPALTNTRVPSTPEWGPTARPGVGHDKRIYVGIYHLLQGLCGIKKIGTFVPNNSAPLLLTLLNVFVMR